MEFSREDKTTAIKYILYKYREIIDIGDMISREEITDDIIDFFGGGYFGVDDYILSCLAINIKDITKDNIKKLTTYKSDIWIDCLVNNNISSDCIRYIYDNYVSERVSESIKSLFFKACNTEGKILRDLWILKKSTRDTDYLLRHKNCPSEVFEHVLRNEYKFSSMKHRSYLISIISASNIPSELMNEAIKMVPMSETREYIDDILSNELLINKLDDGSIDKIAYYVTNYGGNKKRVKKLIENGGILKEKLEAILLIKDILE